jgi:glycosyltransferase involved in cell wall biosynthesis
MNPNIGGVQRVSDILAKYLMKKGYNVYCLTFLEHDDSYSPPFNIFSLPDKEFFSKTNLKYYHNLIKTLKIHVIINHDASNDRSRFFLNTGNLQVKKISFYHQDPIQGFNAKPKHFLLKLIYSISPKLSIYLRILKRIDRLNFLITSSDAIVYLSERFCSDLWDCYRLKSDKFKVIPNPITTINSISAQKLNKIVFVGRLEFEQKRPELALEIWSRLANVFPDWEFIFLGDGIDRLQLENQVLTRNIKNVSFKGFVDPVPYYQEASIICMTSEYEGFGIVLVEAMNVGVVPISFSNWSSIHDIITDKENGILVENDNIEIFTRELKHLISNESFRSQLSINALKTSRNFDIEVIGPKWIDLIENI